MDPNIIIAAITSMISIVVAVISIKGNLSSTRKLEMFKLQIEKENIVRESSNMRMIKKMSLLGSMLA